MWSVHCVIAKVSKRCTRKNVNEWNWCLLHKTVQKIARNSLIIWMTPFGVCLPSAYKWTSEFSLGWTASITYTISYHSQSFSSSHWPSTFLSFTQSFHEYFFLLVKLCWRVLIHLTIPPLQIHGSFPILEANGISFTFLRVYPLL